MAWQDSGQGTHVNMAHVAMIEFDGADARVFVPRGSALHHVAGGSQEIAEKLRSIVASGGPWVRVRHDGVGDAEEHYANLSLAAVVEFSESEDGPVATITTLGGALVGQAHLPDALRMVHAWVATEPR